MIKDIAFKHRKKYSDEQCKELLLQCLCSSEQTELKLKKSVQPYEHLISCPACYQSYLLLIDALPISKEPSILSKFNYPSFDLSFLPKRKRKKSRRFDFFNSKPKVGYTVPHMAYSPASFAGPVRRSRAKLIVLPENGEIPILADKTIIGRHSFSGYSVMIHYISREHAIIIMERDKYYIEDKQSTNGTKLNGVEIRGKGKQELRDGDKVEIVGTITVIFKLAQYPAISKKE